MTTFYDQDAEAESAVNPTYDPAMAGTVHLPDRRSVFRREADRSIIADQAETIKMLEARLAMARLAIAEAGLYRDQRDEAVRLLRAYMTGGDFDSEDELDGVVQGFLQGLEG